MSSPAPHQPQDADEHDPPRVLSLKERIAALQQAANSSQLHSTPVSTPSTTSHPPPLAPRPLEPASSSSATTSLPLNLGNSSRTATAPTPPPIRAPKPTTATTQTNVLSRYPPLSPTPSSSSRAASPFKSPPSSTLDLDTIVGVSSRSRAGSSASALSVLSAASASSNTGSGAGGGGVPAGLGVSLDRLGADMDSSRSRSGSMLRRTSPSPELTRLDTSIKPRTADLRNQDDELMAFSPDLTTPSASSFPATNSTTSSNPPPLAPRPLVPSSASPNGPPPRLPPRRSTTASSSSSASSIAPALPPRPRATLPLSRPSTSTPPLPSRPSSSSVTTTHRTASPSPSPSPRPTHSRHSSPKAAQEGFESISLSSEGGALLAQSLSTSIVPPAEDPLSRSNGNSVAVAPGKKERPMDPRARKRYEGLWEACVRAQQEQEGRPRWVQPADGGETRLQGALVKGVWERSRLSQSVLQGFWNACDVESRGALTRPEFLKGLWMIDEELLRCSKLRC